VALRRIDDVGIRHRMLASPVKALLLAAVYYAAARLGLQLQFEATQATPIWPPSGIALAALVLLGPQLAPGVFLGAFAANLADFLVKSGAVTSIDGGGIFRHFSEHPGEIAISAAIGLGNMLEALSGAYLVRRFGGTGGTFGDVRNVVVFIAAGLACSVVGSVIGIVSLVLGAALPPPVVSTTWFVWWLGDATGISVVTPLVLAWCQQERDQFSGKAWIRMGFALLVLLAVGEFIFDDRFSNALSRFSSLAFNGRLDLAAFQHAYLIIPVLLWIVFRFGRRGGTLGVATASTIAVVGTVNSHGPFAGPEQHVSLLVLQVFNAVMSVTVLLIGATLGERRGALRRVTETLEGRVAEASAALRETERQFSVLVRGITEYAIYMLDPQGRVSNWNPGAERIKGYTASEVVGQHFSIFYTEDDRLKGLPEQGLAAATRAGRHESEGWRVRKDGSRFWANAVIDAIRDDDGMLIGFAKITRDLTERVAIEERIRQSEKMETLGQLTGGIAHDFNNLLTVIYGGIEMLQRRLQTEAPELRRHADTALRGAERAATLTHQLLAFARRQPLAPKPIELNRLVRGMSELLRRTLSESIAIETVLAGGLWWTTADASQLENAILNLAVNARDAMPNGGKLTIETANAYLDEAYATANPDATPGQYVMVAVSDTGTGMTSDVLLKAFEPFFTTKGSGGTGLGLASLYGFVKQTGGHVKIYSEPGEGAAVKIYLPRLATAPESGTIAKPQRAPTGAAGETILVVEDDLDVGERSRQVLSELGYRVLIARDAQTALRILEKEANVQLLFTDVGLPGGFNGRQLADEAQRRWPGLKVLFTTGYARNAIIHQGRLDPDVELLAKPFTYAALAQKARQVLDG
jgi:PAS domain S-box-containing protein